MTDCTVRVSLLVPDGKRPELTDVGREALAVESLSFNNIIMNEVCYQSILIQLTDNKATKFD